MTRDALGMVADRPSLTPYDPRWPELFDVLEGKLRASLGSRIRSVHHIGSTSIPGLSAKPILDVLIGVEDLGAALSCVPMLAELGFEHGPEDDIAARLYFRGQRSGLRTHHLSIAEESSPHFRNALFFRDRLRESPELAREYETLKQKLHAAHRVGQEVHRGKTDFVKRVLSTRPIDEK